MTLKNLVYLFVFCMFSVSVDAQVSENAQPTFEGKISSLEYVSSLASRPDDLIPTDKTPKEAKDKRSLGNQIKIEADPQQEDDYFVRNRNPKEQSKSSLPPSIVFDAYSSGSQPTDPSMAVGPNHVFVVFNTGFAIYDKLGNELVGETSPNPAIFPSGGCCDLTATYDYDADRWVLSFLGSGAQVAVSDGPDPVNDGWYVYTISAINDYQKLSMWSDGYYMTDNTNSSNKVWAMERDLMLAGDPNAQIIGFDLPGITTSGFYSPQAFNVTNGTLPAAGNVPIVYMQDDAWSGVSEDHLKIWTIDVDWANTGNSTISSPVEIATTPFIGVFDGGSFVNLSQPTGGTDVDALQATIMNQAQFRKYEGYNSAVFNFVVDTDSGSGELAGIRWFELRQNADGLPWSIHQEGTYTAPDGRHAWHGSMTMDGAGNIAMGYTSMSGPTTPTTVRISSYFTGRMDGDPLNTMTSAEQLIANGNANIPGTRYGDYNKIEVDPTDDATFWFINEYMNNGRKGVVGAFTLEPPIPDNEAPTDPSNLVASNITDMTATLTWTAATDNVGVTQYNVFIDGVLVGTSSGTTFNVTGLDPLTTYDASVNAQDAAGNISPGFATTTFTTLDAPPPMYCESESSNVNDEFISRVELNTIDNTSDAQFYSDFTGISTNLTEGETYTITVTPTWTGTIYDEGYAVWIDYNNDIDFDDAGELVWSAAANTDTPNEGTFTVPAGTSLESVRMRVSMKYNDIPGPCESFTWGEVEDYTINLMGDNPCSTLDSNDGESGWGIWNDGGADAALVNNATFANSGTYSFLIKDNTSTSVITTDDLDLSGSAEFSMEFNFITTGFNTGTQDFWLQISNDGGGSFSTIQTWTYLDDFANNSRVFENVFVEGPFSSNTQLRFRCDANGNNDKVYIDDIVIDNCNMSTATCSDGVQNQGETEIDCGGPNCSPCSGCFSQDFTTLEDSWSVWNDGGNDCRRNDLDQAFANSGVFCARLQDDTDQSVMTTDNFDMSAYEFINLNFSYITSSMESGEGFIAQYSIDGGATFIDFESWELNTDFVNGVREDASASSAGPFSTTTQIRIRCNGSNNSDRVYIDDINFDGCYEITGASSIATDSRVSHGAKLKTFTNEYGSKINLYPNPARNTLTVDIEEGKFSEVLVFAASGKQVATAKQGAQKFDLDLSEYTPGMYFIRFVSSNGLAITKRFVKE